MTNKVDEMVARFDRETTPKWCHSIRMTNETCEYCRKDTPVPLIDDGTWSAVIDSDLPALLIRMKYRGHEGDGSDLMLGVNYCPMCGRHLSND